ncbi:MAG: hypothetical protein U0835_13630 [Isosphaeraceae bacterium]
MARILGLYAAGDGQRLVTIEAAGMPRRPEGPGRAPGPAPTAGAPTRPPQTAGPGTVPARARRGGFRFVVNL